MKSNLEKNSSLKAKLEKLALDNPDYWSFKGNAKRDHGHGLFQYPAMMVPQMITALLEAVCSEEIIKKVGDPFSGSGTVLTESTLQGLNFIGRDINPLAVLLCKVKSGPFYKEAIDKKVELLLKNIKKDKKSSVDISFPNIDKWFSESVKKDLARIYRAIQKDNMLWSRRFFWTALAETVRTCSNSRTTTFKLHMRPSEEIKSRKINVLVQFEKIVRSNATRLNLLNDALLEKGHLNKGRYTGAVEMYLGDARTRFSETVEQCDVVITSPPYGDNTTTVPYGQYSYLPLQWINLNDIDSNANSEYLRTTQEIDRRSLGGKSKITPEYREKLRTKSANLSIILDSLSSEPADRTARVLSFVRDLDECLSPTFQMLKKGGVMIWILGNRKVGGKSIPLDAILSDLLKAKGASPIAEIKRRIPSKRMASRNNVTETMNDETILVFRR